MQQETPSKLVHFELIPIGSSRTQDQKTTFLPFLTIHNFFLILWNKKKTFILFFLIVIKLNSNNHQSLSHLHETDQQAENEQSPIPVAISGPSLLRDTLPTSQLLGTLTRKINQQDTEHDLLQQTVKKGMFWNRPRDGSNVATGKSFLVSRECRLSSILQTGFTIIFYYFFYYRLRLCLLE